MASSSLVVRPSKIIIREINGELVDADDAGSVSPLGSSSRRVAPWLMLPPEFEEESTVLKFYRVAKGDVVRVQLQAEEDQDGDIPDLRSACLGSLSKGWLVCIQPKDCYLFLFNPLSRRTIQLPSFETFCCIKGVIRNPLSGSVESVLNHDSDPMTPQFVSKYLVRSMALSSLDPTDEDCICMVTCGPDRELAFCRRPAECNSWTALDSPFCDYDRIVFHTAKKLFFALNKDKKLQAWDLHSDPIKSFLIHNEDFDLHSWPCSAADDAELERKSHYCWDTDYLVYDHLTHELFVVTRYTAYGINASDGTLLLPLDDVDVQFPYKTQTFDVFKLDFVDDDHVDIQYLNSLGDRAFFIGFNSGFALSTTMFPELRPNSIYFTDDLFHCHWYRTKMGRNCGGHDLGVYDYIEEIFLPCYYPVDADKIQRILPAPIWFTPDVDATCLASALGL